MRCSKLACFLLLGDGRRIGLVGASDATDVNQIPIALIERVEVLKEGAGAIYGSDAIGGVVNFITKPSFEGFSITGQSVKPQRNGGAVERRGSFIVGKGTFQRVD
jgi:iron complex outermembrane receptor protein